MKYQILDHTGDLRIIVYGRSYKELFQNALYGMADCIIKIKNDFTDSERSIKIKKNSYEDLLISFLSEALYELEINRVLYYKSDLEINDMELNGIIKGFYLKGDIEYEYIIKAVTYYDLEIRPEDGFLKIVFDI
ncbi:archease [Picrophilus oshimae]|uniref:Hypothetical cytosolic protein n=1 Tax=Picrophilus torridus (strain ATCC 700027 / DSM 9790 / JCM 10055 / NBRC 100828 / KAW 2/3) TaxID=1122961 RepID=Q6KZS7_PICTO|nr:archease [Picrophilus oshimae]AAT43775.1 hypothetical cytosolic protein [Picrophilus oshimae DSM 9789]SMD31158.1 SHS2 domain-containing protein [Picrophilus oshimae DSM 9789]